MTSRVRIALLWIRVLLFASAVSFASRAAPPVDERSARALVATLAGDLSDDEQALLLKSAQCAGACHFDPAQSAVMRSMQKTLASRGFWRAALTARLNPAVVESPADDIATAHANEILARATDIISEPKTPAAAACAATIKAKVSSYVAHHAEASDDVPFSTTTLTTGCLATALGQPEKSLAKHLLVAVYGRSDDVMRVFFDEHAIRVDAHVDVGTHRLFLVAVPANRYTTVEVSGLSRQRPWLRSKNLFREQQWWSLPEKHSGCIQLGMRGGLPADTVLVNGIPTTERSITADVDTDYDVVVVRAGDSKKPERLIFERRVAAEELKNRVECVQVNADLTPLGNSVALLSVAAGPECLSSGVDEERIRRRVIQLLKGAGKDPRDMRGWAQTVKGLDELRAILQAPGTRPIGSDRGHGDSWLVVGESSSELWRQGFESVLSVALRCGGRKSERGSEFTISANMMDLRVFESLKLDTRSGAEVAAMTKTDVENTSDQSDVAGALGMLIARLYQHPYLRFVGQEETREFQLDEQPHVIDVALPDALLKDETPTSLWVKTKYLTQEEATNVCTDIEHQDRARIPIDPASATKLLDDRPPRKQPGSDVVRGAYEENACYRLEQRPYQRAIVKTHPARPGTYLLRAELRDTGAVTYRCVQVGERRAAIGLEFGTTWDVFGPFGRNRAARTEDAQYYYVLAKLSYALKNTGGLVIGGVAGYGRGDHERAASPSWDDLGIQVTRRGPAPPVRVDSNADQTIFWSRQSGLLGISFGYSWPAFFCRWADCSWGFVRGIALTAAVMPLVDIGTTNARDSVRARNPVFFDDSDRIKVDMSVLASAGVHFDLGTDKYVEILGNAAAVSFTDFFLNSGQRDALSRATYGSMSGIGTSVSMGYRP